MSTGVESYLDPANVGVLYPFAGLEIPLAVAGILLWIGWHVRQVITENRELSKADKHFRETGVQRVCTPSDPGPGGVREP